MADDGATLKMYILVRDAVLTGFAVLASAHASLACYLRFQDDVDVQEWVSGKFYKTVCRVNDKEFEKAKSYPDHVVITESALDEQEVALAFSPRREWPKPLRFYRLYK